MKTWKANIMILIAAMFWGGGFVATDRVIQHISPVQMQTLRFSMSALLCLILFHKKIAKVNKQSVFFGVVIGIAFFLAMTFQNYGLVFTTIPKNAFITVTNVIWSPLLGYLFFRSKINGSIWKGIIIMMIGFIFLLFEIDIFNFTQSIRQVSELTHLNFGDFLTLLSAILFALQFVLQDKFVDKQDPVVILTFQLITASILSLISATVIHESVFAIPLDALQVVILPIIFLVICPTIISFGFVLIAQQYIKPSNTAILVSTESLFATLFAIVLGQANFHIAIVIGAIIITCGIIYAETGFKFGKKYQHLEEKSYEQI